MPDVPVIDAKLESADNPVAEGAQHDAAPQPGINTAFADLDALMDKAAEEGSGKFLEDVLAEKPEAKPEAKPAAKAQPKTPPKTEAKETPKAEETKPVEPPKPPRAAELRAAYDKTKATLKERDTELAKLRAEIEQIKAAKPAEDPEKKALVEQLRAIEAKHKELETELSFSNYQKSKEYEEKYLAPLNAAYQIGRQKVAQLRFMDDDTGEMKTARAEDFDQLVGILDDNAAVDFANQAFGNRANIALLHRERVHELNNLAKNAVENFRKTGEERQKNQAAEQAKLAEVNKVIWEKSNQEFADKFPEIAKPADDDNDSKTLLTEGYKLTDLAFHGDGKLPPEELVRLSAAVRNRSAVFGLLFHRNKKLSERINELESELAKFTDSEPGKGDVEGEAAATEPDEYDADAWLDREAR